MIDTGEDFDYPDGSDLKYPLRSGIITNRNYVKIDFLIILKNRR